MCQTRYAEAVKAHDKKQREFDPTTSRIMSEWKATISDETIRNMALIPGYEAADMGNELLDYWNFIRREMLGEGVASIQAEFARLEKWTYKDEDWKEKFTEFPEMIERIMDRGIDAEEVLRTFFSTKFVLALKASERLKLQVASIMTEPRWPTYAELIPRLSHAMRVSHEFDPKPEGIIANAGGRSEARDCPSLRGAGARCDELCDAWLRLACGDGWQI